MSKTALPSLKRYLDKEIDFKLNGNRKVTGMLRGFDPFMNMVVADAIEHHKDGTKNQLGAVIVRGNSVVSMEPRERIELKP
ncbi:Small nuclear ribonucleoprotein G [Aphelenchoides bicaudatus]|nr:Small nuclear ribonucleoprotein G [Aphelenchoides bicaudatus]